MIQQILSTFVAIAPQAAGAPSLDAKPSLTGASNAATPGGVAAVPGGAPVPGAADSGVGGGQGSLLIMMLAIVGVMIVFSVVGGRRERKKRAQMLGSIKKHDKVLTVGGIVGSVVEFKDDTVILKVDEQTNTRITVSKTSISQVLAGASAD